MVGSSCCLDIFKLILRETISSSVSKWIAVHPLGREYVYLIWIFWVVVFFILFFIFEKLLGFRLLGILSIILISILFLVFAICTGVAIPGLVSGGFFHKFSNYLVQLTAFSVNWVFYWSTLFVIVIKNSLLRRTLLRLSFWANNKNSCFFKIFSLESESIWEVTSINLVVLSVSVRNVWVVQSLVDWHGELCIPSTLAVFTNNTLDT